MNFFKSIFNKQDQENILIEAHIVDGCEFIIFKGMTWLELAKSFEEGLDRHLSNHAKIELKDAGNEMNSIYLIAYGRGAVSTNQPPQGLKDWQPKLSEARFVGDGKFEILAYKLPGQLRRDLESALPKSLIDAIEQKRLSSIERSVALIYGLGFLRGMQSRLN